MEPTKFDELTKALATSTSRRQALKTIAATTFAGLLGLGGIGPAFAKPKCHRQGTGCHTTSQCCTGLSCQNGKCAPCTANGGTCSVNTNCCSGNCSNGFCCGSGQVGLCNGSCATPCTANTDCSADCVCASDRSGATYCAPLDFEGNSCGTDCNCPLGQFCGVGEVGGACTALC